MDHIGIDVHKQEKQIREWTERLAARRGRFIAVVAVVRRLAGIDQR